jgi:lipoprotein NlpI
VGLFTGRTTPDVVRSIAEGTPGAYGRRLRTCEADFYIAEYHLTKSAGEDARKLLQAAVAECPATAPEASFAKAELARLGSQAQN